MIGSLINRFLFAEQRGRSQQSTRFCQKCSWAKGSHPHGSGDVRGRRQNVLDENVVGPDLYPLLSKTIIK